MKVITARNVNDAYHKGMELISWHGNSSPSRAGDVLVVPEPVTTIYERPTERVLFNPVRDANPFFHLMESVWMLAGRRDATWLDRFVKDFSSRFAEEDGNAHGAYGYRWRHHFDMEGGGFVPDQLITVGQMLRADPNTRRAVLTMWDPVADLGADKKDLPCNCMVFFRTNWDHVDQVWVLDMTVMNRSNDIIWGAYGANAVHMSILMEVIAGLAGMKVGRYYQVSNNYHAYEHIWHRLYQKHPASDPYLHGAARPFPIVAPGEDALEILDDAVVFCDYVDEDTRPPVLTAWFKQVITPMYQTHRLWKEKQYDKARSRLDSVMASDWRLAGQVWMNAREARRELAQMRAK